MRKIFPALFVILAIQNFGYGEEVGNKAAPAMRTAAQTGTIGVPFELEDLRDLERRGYSPSNGGKLHGPSEEGLWYQQYCKLNRENFPARPVRLVSCVIVLNTVASEDAKSAPQWHNEDAIQIDFKGDGQDLFDTGDTYCASSLYPSRSVFAVGYWALRKKPQVGGYAYSISHAWIVDPDIKAFKKIPATSVKCEVNEDRD